MQEPHPVLPCYYDDVQGKRRFVDRMFDASAGDYDRVDRVLAFGTGSRYRADALRRAGLAQGMRMLDVAVGTGLVAKEALGIVGSTGSVTGVDPSAGMMSAAGAGLTLVRGRAEALPFAGGTFDFLTLGFALRHLSDLDRVFAEFHRVLKPGGRLLLLEITRPQGRLAQLMLKAYMRGLVPMLAGIVGRSRETPALYRYYWDTIEACVPPAQVMSSIAAAGFTGVRRNVALGIFSEFAAAA
jgi:demethylmenaquinone methyltransferase/2-methoxy-6-polyprenyl-1,4-benzoquinol methylase